MLTVARLAGDAVSCVSLFQRQLMSVSALQSVSCSGVGVMVVM